METKMSKQEENPGKQSLKDIQIEFQTGSNKKEVQMQYLKSWTDLMDRHTVSACSIKKSQSAPSSISDFLTERIDEQSIKRAESAPSSISDFTTEHADEQSQLKDSKKEQFFKKLSYSEIKMEDIFGERKAIIDGEELIEVVDTFPKGPAYYCCKDGETSKGCYRNVYKGYSISDRGYSVKKSPISIKLVQFKSVRTFVKDKEFGIVPLEVFMMKKIQGHSAAVKFLHYQPLSEEHYVIITERSKHSADLYGMFCDGKLPFAEDSARTIIHEIASVLRALETKNIVHRDVRSDNIMYDLDSGDAKLIDFSMARKHKPWQKFKDRTDNRMNWPPEYVEKKSFDPRKATSWALGTVLFELVNGVPPYAGVNHAVNARKLVFFENVSFDCADLIRGLLCKNPSKRYSLKKVLKHPWVTGEERRSIFRLPSFVNRIFRRP